MSLLTINPTQSSGSSWANPLSIPVPRSQGWTPAPSWTSQNIRSISIGFCRMLRKPKSPQTQLRHSQRVTDIYRSKTATNLTQGTRYFLTQGISVATSMLKLIVNFSSSVFIFSKRFFVFCPDKSVAGQKSCEKHIFYYINAFNLIGICKINFL